MSTTGDDALLVLYSALPREEQDAGYERITAHRLSADAASEDDMARYIRSLRRVVEHLGWFPTTTEYKTVSLELIAAGEDLETFARVYGRFGSWRRAAEALGMAGSDSPRRVEARFKFRQRGRPHRFTDAQLADAMARAATECGGVPTTKDYAWWRHGQLEVANAQGDHDLMLPSLSSFRRRWGSWRETLVGCGYTKTQVVERMGHGRPKTSPWTLASDEAHAAALPVAQLRPSPSRPSGLTLVQTHALVGAWNHLPHRSKHVFGAHLGLLDGGVESFPSVATRFRVTPGRVGQVYRDDIARLGQAVASAGGMAPRDMRRSVENALRALSDPAE